MKTFECKDAHEVAKEALWLAWQACGGPLGMGILQDNGGATKKDVVENVMSHGDYPGAALIFKQRKGEINADYAFGRMMKLRCEFKKGSILYPESKPTFDYQSWCVVYPTYEELFKAAEMSLAAE